MPVSSFLHIIPHQKETQFLFVLDMLILELRQGKESDDPVMNEYIN